MLLVPRVHLSAIRPLREPELALVSALRVRDLLLVPDPLQAILLVEFLLHRAHSLLALLLLGADLFLIGSLHAVRAVVGVGAHLLPFLLKILVFPCDLHGLLLQGAVHLLKVRDLLLQRCRILEKHVKHASPLSPADVGAAKPMREGLALLRPDRHVDVKVLFPAFDGFGHRLPDLLLFVIREHKQRIVARAVVDVLRGHAHLLREIVVAVERPVHAAPHALHDQQAAVQLARKRAHLCEPDLFLPVRDMQEIDLLRDRGAPHGEGHAQILALALILRDDVDLIGDADGLLRARRGLDRHDVHVGGFHLLRALLEILQDLFARPEVADLVRGDPHDIVREVGQAGLRVLLMVVILQKVFSEIDCCLHVSLLFFVPVPRLWTDSYHRNSSSE